MSLRSTTLRLAIILAVGGVAVVGCTSPSPATSALTAEVLTTSVVLDVRTAGEHAEGHLKGDHNISVEALDSRLADVEALVGKDKNARIVVYCRSGSRSAKAKGILTRAGYTNVVNAGGYGSIVGQFPAVADR